MHDWKAFADRVTQDLRESVTGSRRYLIEGLGVLLASKRDLLIYEKVFAEISDEEPVVAPTIDWDRLIAKLRTSGLEAAGDAELVAIALSPKHIRVLFAVIEQEILTAETHRSPWRRIYQEQFARMMAD